MDELDRVVKHYVGLIENVVEQIPEQTAVKVSSDFYEVYHKKA